MIALVKGTLFYFLQMFPNLCAQIYSFQIYTEFWQYFVNIICNTLFAIWQ